jgi:hypothetical protein
MALLSQRVLFVDGSRGLLLLSGHIDRSRCGQGLGMGEEP